MRLSYIIYRLKSIDNKFCMNPFKLAVIIKDKQYGIVAYKQGERGYVFRIMNGWPE